MRLHVAVGHGTPGWFHDEVRLPAAFAEHGIDAVPQHWRDIPADGSPVLIRTAWDYTQDRDRFLAWLDALEAAESPVINDAATMRWNLDKRYMLELEASGHAIVPTKVVDTLADAVGHWDAAIAKPVVGGGAEGLHLIDGDDVRLVPVPGNRWGEARATGPWLVQPRLDMTGGEWSLFYFGGAYSHAVLKRPKAGDLRVQEEHGGTTQAMEPPADARRGADALVAAHPCIQARVDGVMIDGAWRLMELELIEPELYFRCAPGSEARFAAAVAAALRA